MFGYFGSKSRIIHHYPPPEHDLIIEPFAGSARYACKWGLDRDVWLNDKYIVIYKIWKWIQSATKSDVDGFPILKKGDDLRDIKYLSEIERLVLGMAVGSSRNSSGNVVSEWAADNGLLEKLYKRLYDVVGRISHWRVTCLDYEKCVSQNPATYFVDPPYQLRKYGYVVTNPEPDFYSKLATHCKRLEGQVIVCESQGADWLPFKWLVSCRSTKGTSNEVIWTNRPEYVHDLSRLDDIGETLM